MSTQSKKAIEAVVRDYVRLAPDEFQTFREGMRMKVKNSLNNFAEMKGGDFIIRELCELPQTLYAMLKVRLTDEDFTWFRTREGGVWFATKFKDFRVSKQV
jgi:hypothetical protein